MGAFSQGFMRAFERDDLPKVMRRLYASEINCGIQSFWDGGWSAWIGDELNGYRAEEINFDTLNEIAEWLHEKALLHYPTSGYARKYG